MNSGWHACSCALRGRDAGYPAPPAQTRTCSFSASGSSVALASAQAETITGPPPVLLVPAGRLTHSRACLQTHHGPAPLLDPALSESRVRATLQTRPSTPAEKFVYTSSRQRLTCIGPLKRLRHSSIEVLDEVEQRLMQLLDGVETGAFEQAPNPDAKPNLDLIEPGGRLGGIDKADPVARIG